MSQRHSGSPTPRDTPRQRVVLTAAQSPRMVASHAVATAARSGSSSSSSYDSDDFGTNSARSDDASISKSWSESGGGSSSGDAYDPTLNTEEFDPRTTTYSPKQVRAMPVVFAPPAAQITFGASYLPPSFVANFSPFGGFDGGQNTPPSLTQSTPRSRAITIASEREIVPVSHTNSKGAEVHRSSREAQVVKHHTSTHSPSPHSHSTPPTESHSKHSHKHDHSHRHEEHHHSGHSKHHNPASPTTPPSHGGSHHNNGADRDQPNSIPPLIPHAPSPHPPSPHSPSPHAQPQHVQPQVPHLQPLHLHSPHSPPKKTTPAPPIIPSALALSSAPLSSTNVLKSGPTVSSAVGVPADLYEPDPTLLEPPPSTETLDRSLKAKLSIERFYLDTLMQDRNERLARKELLEVKIADLPPRSKSEMRKQLAACESYFLRSKRRPMTARDFTTVCVLGRGAFGEVRLVRKKNTNEIFAMKKLSKADMMKKNQVAHVRAERDILVAAHNNNPWVVKLHYSFQDEDYLYLIMEYLPGGDMMGLLIKQDTFPEEVARFYIVEILLALDSVHQCNYIHRDIKPDNLLLDSEGHIKLTDFGLCTGFHKMHSSEFYERVMADAQLLKLKNIMDKVPNRLRDMTIKHNYKQQRCLAFTTVGTPDYTAPEVFQQQGYGTECDYWSVGCILYEMIIGYPPFVSDSSSETCLKILNCDSTLQFPPEPEISFEARDLIQRLVCEQRSRLGVKGGLEEIKAHPFFRGVVWERFHETHAAPLIPQLAGPEDVSHFDAVEKAPDESQEPPPKPSAVESRSPQNLAFIGYTYRSWEGILPSSPNTGRSNSRKQVSLAELFMAPTPASPSSSHTSRL
ncbi:AGC/NDR/NDR protein kinase [Pelomyxa schiedti]|nr:AGC/NDR/NDR protein kinase [Pelomyxa schiedti]